MNKISVEQLSKSFKGQKVLNQITFGAEAGTITALLGQSGAGKTTLLRCLCQLESPDSGNIHLFGKRVGVVFQQFHLWKHLTLLENCTLAPITSLKQPKKLAIQNAEALLSELGLLDKKHHLPSALSGGEQQRGAIARALMMKPEVLLFDEPTSALDPKRTDTVSSIMQALAKQGMIVLVVTHDIALAKRVANRSLFLEQGRIIEETAIQQGNIFPKTRDFAKFLNTIVSKEEEIS